jgi:hypothetical protein
MLSSLAQSRCNIGDTSVRRIILSLLVLPALLLFVGESPAQQPQVPAEQPQIPAQQPRVIDRSVKAQAGKDTRIAVFVTIRNDCTAGPLPTIKLQLPPARGKVSIKSAKVRATNLKHCLAIEVPGFVAFYRVDADFSGTEIVELEVIEAGGNRKIERLTITVGKTNRGENI